MSAPHRASLERLYNARGHQELECSVRRLAHDRCDVDLREGGKFSSRMEAKDGSMGFDFAGTYTKVIQHKLIEYAFGDRTAQVCFTPGPTSVAVRVTFDSEPTHSIEQQRGGWQSILERFTRYVDAKKKS